MKAAQFTVSILLASIGLMASGAVSAAPQPLSDQEMSDSYAGDGTAGIPVLGESPFAAILTALINPISKERTMLQAPEFLQVMAANGVSSLPSEVYNGQNVTQIVLPSNPITVTMKLSQFISSATGVKFDAPGMGNLTIQNLDMGGTRLWTWNH